MNRARMVHDANQIALYFASSPRDEAVAGIADHLTKFWTPGMRREIGEYARAGGAGLHELAREAVRQLDGPL